MARQTKRLGRGLESLIATSTLDETLQAEAQSEKGPATAARRRTALQAVVVRPEALEPNPLQPRSGIRNEDVQGLAESLRVAGMIQPIVARRVSDKFIVLSPHCNDFPVR